MSTKNTISGGNFQDAEGNTLAGGHLVMQLSQDAATSDGVQVAAGFVVTIELDNNGDVVNGAAVWPNDVLLPVGTFYNVSAFSAQGALVWGPNAQQVFSTPTPFDIGTWIPSAVNTQPISILSVSNVTLATSATAGSAALPSNPVAFLPINVNGTNYKIPLYSI